MTHDLPSFVDAERDTVRASECGCADIPIQLLSVVPEDGMHSGVDGRPPLTKPFIGNEVLIPWAKFPNPGAIPPGSMTAGKISKEMFQAVEDLGAWINGARHLYSASLLRASVELFSVSCTRGSNGPLE